MDGNIGYINLTGFKNPKYAGKTADAAMAFLSNTDTIIIDLRENGGGIGIKTKTAQAARRHLWQIAECQTVPKSLIA